MHLRTYDKWQQTDRSWGTAELVLSYGGRDYRIQDSSGANDSTEIFREPGGRVFYIYVENHRLGYAGLTDVDLDYLDKMGEGIDSAYEPSEGIFLQGWEQTDETLGKGWENKTSIHNAKILAQWLE
jgi:hypothetical protein